MLTRLLLAFLIVFVGTTFLGAIMAGGGGIVSTTLSDDITASADFIPATSTETFANKDVLMVEQEKILYDSKNTTGFISHTRGYDDTVAANHTAGRTVYTEAGGILNAALGYSVGVELETSGTLGIIQLPIRFFDTTLPHLVVLNVNFLSDNPALAIIGAFWLCAGIGLLIDLSIRIAPIAIAAARAVISFIRG
jgi:hypothetical protein